MARNTNDTEVNTPVAGGDWAKETKPSRMPRLAYDPGVSEGGWGYRGLGWINHRGKEALATLFR